MQFDCAIDKFVFLRQISFLNRCDADGVALHLVVRDVREAGGFVEMDGLNVEF